MFALTIDDLGKVEYCRAGGDVVSASLQLLFYRHGREL
jgi:hypothetical protein